MRRDNEKDGGKQRTKVELRQKCALRKTKIQTNE
jgi:hypothetical protein